MNLRKKIDLIPVREDDDRKQGFFCFKPGEESRFIRKKNSENRPSKKSTEMKTPNQMTRKKRTYTVKSFFFLHFYRL